MCANVYYSNHLSLELHFTVVQIEHHQLLFGKICMYVVGPKFLRIPTKIKIKGTP